MAGAISSHVGDIRCRKGAELCCLRRVSAWKASRARDEETLSPRRGNGIQSESWDCNHLLRKKLPVSPLSDSLLSAHTPAIFSCLLCSISVPVGV